MKVALRIVLYVLAAPRFLGWLFPLVACGLVLARDLRLGPDATLLATWRPRVASTWRYSTTLAAGIVLHPTADDRVLRHELVHVRQTEDWALAGLVVATVVAAVAGSAWWLLLWPGLMPLQLLGYVAAALRGGHVYRDAEAERSAYAQTDARPYGATSWLEEHESRPQGW